MFVYPVCYQIRSDKVLVRQKMIDDLNLNYVFSFDDFYQTFSSDKFYQKQMEDSLIFAIRNQTFSMFFVFEKDGSLHLFNSRFEVTRFLKENFV